MKKNKNRFKLKITNQFKGNELYQPNTVINKYLKDACVKYLQESQYMIIEALNDATAIQDREFRILINKKFPDKLKLTGKIKNKIFKEFKSRGLDTSSIIVILKNKSKSLAQTLLAFSELKEISDELCLKAFIWDGHFIDINEDNMDIYKKLLLNNNLIFYSILFILRILYLLFDIILCNYNILLLYKIIK